MRNLLPFFALRLSEGVEGVGGTATLIGALETTYGVGQMVGATFMGRLSDTHGRRAVLMLSLTGAAIGYALAGVAVRLASPTLLLFSRVPVGLAKQTATISRSVVADLTPSGAERSAAMARLASSFGFGFAAGPLIGAWASGRVEDDVLAFAAAAIFLCVILPAVYMCLPETLREGRGDGTAAAGVGEIGGSGEGEGLVVPLLRNQRLLGALLAVAIPEFCLVMHTTTSAPAMAVSTGVTKRTLGFVASSTALLAAAFSGFALPRLVRAGWDDAASMRLGCGCFALASLCLAAGRSEAVLLSAVPLMAVACSVLRAIPPALVSKAAGTASQGGAMGALDLMSSSCRVVAPLVCGLLVDTVGGGAPFLAEAALLGVGVWLVGACAESAAKAKGA